MEQQILLLELERRLRDELSTHAQIMEETAQIMELSDRLLHHRAERDEMRNELHRAEMQNELHRAENRILQTLMVVLDRLPLVAGGSPDPLGGSPAGPPPATSWPATPSLHGSPAGPPPATPWPATLSLDGSPAGPPPATPWPATLSLDGSPAGPPPATPSRPGPQAKLSPPPETELQEGPDPETELPAAGPPPATPSLNEVL